MNPSKKYNRIKYVAQQQDGEGLFDIFKSTGKKITEVATSKFSKEVAKKADSAGIEKFTASGAETLGKSAVDKLIKQSIIEENKPTSNSGEKIVDIIKKVSKYHSPIQNNEVELLKQQLIQFM